MSRDVLIYGPRGSKPLRAFSEFYLADWVEQHVPTSSVPVEDYRLVIVDGLRKQNKKILYRCQQAGIPLVVCDLGYIGRPNYFQVGFDRLNWLSNENKTDRMEKLGITIPKRVHGDYILILGQNPGDASHDFNEFELDCLYQGWADRLRKITDRPIHFRPHPRAWEMSIECDHVDRGPLDQALRGAHCCVTFNSTSGTDALLAGKPLFSATSAQYAKLATHVLLMNIESIEHPRFPNRDDLIDHFSKVAYSQWTQKEIASGEWAEVYDAVRSRTAGSDLALFWQRP